MIFATTPRNRRKPDASRSFGSIFGPAARIGVGLREVFAVVTASGTAVALLWAICAALDRPIGRVEVGGKFQRVAPVEVQSAVAPFRGAGFLSIDLDALQDAVQGIPWVDRARVERRWPGGVRVVITEHIPAARWGEQGLMNTRGELFLRDARHIPPELPHLLGPEGTEETVAQLYLQTYPRLLAAGMRLSKVELDPRGAWQLTLGNGVQVRLGRQDVYERLERFLRVASPVVAARGGEVRYVDLRYSNGFSVGWNPPAARVAHESEDATPDA